jgi:hypothetical protein
MTARSGAPPAHGAGQEENSRQESLAHGAATGR